MSGAGSVDCEEWGRGHGLGGWMWSVATNSSICVALMASAGCLAWVPTRSSSGAVSL